MSKQEKYEETVVDAASAKNKTAYFRGLQTAVVDCLHKVDKETVLGNDSVVVMVHRNYDLEDRSHVGDILRQKGFGVCDADAFDFKGNNYRRIKVSW